MGSCDQQRVDRRAVRHLLASLRRELDVLVSCGLLQDRQGAFGLKGPCRVRPHGLADRQRS
jgi:hypothetical protein